MTPTNLQLATHYKLNKDTVQKWKKTRPEIYSALVFAYPNIKKNKKARFNHLIRFKVTEEVEEQFMQICYELVIDKNIPFEKFIEDYNPLGMHYAFADDKNLREAPFLYVDLTDGSIYDAIPELKK